ncbi:phosphotransferase family protein [Streptomyces marincola]|uniref:phosphotransferase family protein n=1 Tax=Streptomyces marincola TaxID=2878388 RepID=UPI001CF52E6C|nr:aminoglycoside phosphotransferase family protein [Streptomyces marincola]UCM90623.1 aminoglycoside phosphotransferase family protein [Streptomyces marincola]
MLNGPGAGGGRGPGRPPLSPGGIGSDDAYARIRNDAGFWEPWVRPALERLGFSSVGDLRVPGASTSPVLVSSTGLVVKLYGAHWYGPESFAVESEAYRLLEGTGLPVPNVLARGELYPRSDDWTWPFMVLEAVPGRTWREATEDMATPGRLALARRLGTVLRQVHEVPLSAATGPLRPESTRFADVLRERRAATVADHREWGHLPPALLDGVPGFLPEIDALLGDRPPVFVHGDLHGTNLFVGTGPERVSGLIDFADSYAGDPRYSLVQLHLNAFGADRSLLRAALEGADWPVPGDFPRQMLAFTFLHDFDVLENVPLDLTGVSSLDDLAGLLWDVGS